MIGNFLDSVFATGLLVGFAGGFITCLWSLT